MSQTNFSAVDQIVGEYLIYRGFTQTFRSFEGERIRDKARSFDVSKLIEAIFSYLNNFDIDSFISLWDFLSKRFFFHLDSEHVQYSQLLKSDLLKYYLVHAVKAGRRDRLTDFFSSFSQEILSESGDSIAGGFRGWFVLPYMDEPERDSEFAIYFTSRWSDSLRITIGNFLSIVLQTAPPPKLLLLEKWFHADAQQEIRSQLSSSSRKVDLLLVKLEKSEERLAALRTAVKELIHHVQKASIGAQSAHVRGNMGLFETDEEADAKRGQAKEIGQSLCRTANECASKSAIVASLPKEARLKEILGHQVAGLFFRGGKPSATYSKTLGAGESVTAGSSIGGAGTQINPGRDDLYENLTELELQMVSNVQKWLRSISV